VTVPECQQCNNAKGGTHQPLSGLRSTAQLQLVGGFVRNPRTGPTLVPLIAFSAIFVISTFGCTAPERPARPNILLIAVDDLRPELGCYGADHVVSPNIDRLASEGLLFTRAYCQSAVCNPSRASLMTGKRPDTLRVWDLSADMRTLNPDVVTLGQHLRANGYHSVGIRPRRRLPWSGGNPRSGGEEGRDYRGWQ